MANAAQLLAARRKQQNTVKVTGGTAYLPGGSSGAVTGAHLPGGTGNPGVYSPGAPAPSQAGFVPSIPAPPPVDPGIQANLQSARTNITGGLTNTLAGLADQGNRLLFDYGYSAKADPTSGDFDLSTLAVDPQVDVTNPFSKAALLQRSFNQARAGNTTGYGAAGQLYSGAYRRAQRNTRFGYEQGQDALQKGLGSALAELIRRRRAARTQANTDLNAAEFAALNAQLGVK